MRFEFDLRKSELLRTNPRRGIGFEEAQAIFSQPYYLDQRSDLPEQYRAIGWVGLVFYSLIFEIREDELGEYTHLVTLWKSTREEQHCMKSTRSPIASRSAEEIAQLAEDGHDVSGFFTGKGRMMTPLHNATVIQRVNVDFTGPMLEELDEAAQSLNVSRQAVIKTLLRQALDLQYVARNAALTAKQK